MSWDPRIDPGHFDLRSWQVLGLKNFLSRRALVPQIDIQYIYSTFTVHHSGPNFEIFGARFPAVDGSKVDLARQHITLACRLPMH